MDGAEFETWLGSIVNPNEPFYLLAEDEATLKSLIERTAKIGYEKQIALAFVPTYSNADSDLFDSTKLTENQNDFTILDIRNPSEIKQNPIFDTTLKIPLYELRERIKDIPSDKPIVVHCAGGYRSAAGSSILQSRFDGTTKVYDLGGAVKQFENAPY